MRRFKRIIGGCSVNKSLVTNLLSIVIIGLGFVSPVYKDQITSIGFFAFSGAITNWIAIYMLFEKVPGLYGSGVIPNRFEEFRAGIKKMIMEQFFNAENIDRFFHEAGNKKSENSIARAIDFNPIIERIDYDVVFSNLVKVVLESSLGGMLMMFGGEQALIPLKEPFIGKMKISLGEIVKSENFLSALEDNLLPQNMSGEIIKKINEIIDQRLEELTPKAVKEIIQEMIRIHLGWLVVWGGVFGGLIGLVMSFVN